LVAVAMMTMFCGCESAPPAATVPSSGFLSDYSLLEPTAGGGLRYANPKYDLRDYSKFIVDPVALYFDEQTKAEVGNWDELERLRAYMRKTLIETLEPRYAAVGTKPGPGTARIRVALTGVKKGKPLATGGASMEAELLDSQTSEQIAALVETRQTRKVYGGLSQWDDAKAVMDGWAKRLYDRLEEARGW
jgi:hypothetical protein